MTKKKRTRKTKTVSRESVPLRLAPGLNQVNALMRRKRWHEAREILNDLDRRYPNREEVLTNLVNACYELHDMQGYQHACERLLRLTPDNADATLGLAGAYLVNMRPVLALRTFHRFLERWPDHKRAGEVRNTVADLEARMDSVLAELGGPPGNEGLELAAQHEEILSLLEQGRHSEVCTVAGRLLRRYPDFIPALNNLSLAHAASGRLDEAIATAQRVLALEPDNYHALGNLVRYCYLSGRIDEAREYAERLKAVESKAVDVWVKKAEALSYLGDDQGVLDVFGGAERSGYLKPPFANPMLYHFAAVAALRLGQEDQARRYWNEALKLAPGLDPARANQADLRKPASERHAPWAFGLQYWISEQALRRLTDSLLPAFRRGSEEAITQAVRRYLCEHPEVVHLIPVWLDRGDPEARQLAMHLAQAAETPEMLTALRDFALGQRGPDRMRMEAARVVSEAGLLSPGPTRIWLQGEWREMLLMGFELHDEPTYRHKPRVERWLAEATMLLKAGDARQAERLSKQALQVEPNAPDLLNNLAVAYEAQGRVQDAEALLHQIVEQHPDYAFPRIGLSRLHLSRGELDKARALLESVLSQRRLHFDEFAALCMAQIELLLAEGNRKAARSWLEMWKSADPENPQIAQMEARIGRFRLPFFRKRRA
jgi:tetratricopeptide (TPR) repeat protein